MRKGIPTHMVERIPEGQLRLPKQLVLLWRCLQLELGGDNLLHGFLHLLGIEAWVLHWLVSLLLAPAPHGGTVALCSAHVAAWDAAPVSLPVLSGGARAFPYPQGLLDRNGNHRLW